MEPEVKVDAVEQAPEQERRIEVFIEKDGKKFSLVMPEHTEIGAAYDAAYRLLMRVVEIAKEAAEKAKPKQAE